MAMITRLGFVDEATVALEHTNFECGLRERLSDVSAEVCRKMRWAGSIRPNILSRINGQEPDRMKIMHA